MEDRLFRKLLHQKEIRDKRRAEATAKYNLRSRKIGDSSDSEPETKGATGIVRPRRSLRIKDKQGAAHSKETGKTGLRVKKVNKPLSYLDKKKRLTKEQVYSKLDKRKLNSQTKAKLQKSQESESGDQIEKDQAEKDQTEKELSSETDQSHKESDSEPLESDSSNHSGMADQVTIDQIRQVMTQMLGPVGPALNDQGGLAQGQQAQPTLAQQLADLQALQNAAQHRPAVAKPPGPGIFRGEHTENAKDWIERLIDYINFVGYDQDERKMAAVKLHLADQARLWFNTLTDAVLNAQVEGQAAGQFPNFVTAFRQTEGVSSPRIAKNRRQWTRKSPGAHKNKMQIYSAREILKALVSNEG